MPYIDSCHKSDAVVLALKTDISYFLLFHQQGWQPHADFRYERHKEQCTNHRKVERQGCLGQTFYRNLADSRSDKEYSANRRRQ